MGALHEGHASLIRQARASSERVLVTIFVNPTQFGPAEDFARYPRTLESDCRVAQDAGATAIFVPSIETVYPQGFESASREAAALALPRVAILPQLEDAFRPTHFGGVCQVVARLFDLCASSQAYFGEKDFQQLRVITEMVRREHARWPGLTVVPCATVREPDGLAMSSRNRFLDPPARACAIGISRALNEARECTRGVLDVPSAEARMRTILEAHGMTPQYAVIRDGSTLEAVTEHSRCARALIAATLDRVRLIDNVAIALDRPAC